MDQSVTNILGPTKIGSRNKRGPVRDLSVGSIIMSALRLLVFLSVFSASIGLTEGLDEYYELSKQQIAKLNKATGYEADYWWSHDDRIGGNYDAPYVFLKIQNYQDGDEVGSYQTLRNLMAGKSDEEQRKMFEIAIKEDVDRDTVAKVQVRGVSMIDEDRTTIVFSDLYGYKNDVTIRIRYLIWSPDELRRCRITAEVSKAGFETYNQNAIEALGQLTDYCSHLFTQANGE